VPPLDHQTLDDVEAVEFRLSGRHVGQIPTDRRRGSADAATAVPCAPALEDASDGPDRGEGLDPAGLQRAVDRHGAELAQVALVLQFAAQGQHEVLQGLGRSVGWLAWAVGPVRPVDPIEPPVAGPRDPELNSGQGHPGSASDLAERGAAACGSDHLTAALLGPVFGPSEAPLAAGLWKY
jgi:hypothetical protein